MFLHIEVRGYVVKLGVSRLAKAEATEVSPTPIAKDQEPVGFRLQMEDQK